MQNNVGLQTAYWSGTTPALDIHQIIELTKKANMDTIELKAGDFVPLTTEGRAALRKEIEDARTFYYDQWNRFKTRKRRIKF